MDAGQLARLRRIGWSSLTGRVAPRTSSGIDKKQRTILVPTLGLKREELAPPPETKRAMPGN